MLENVKKMFSLLSPHSNSPYNSVVPPLQSSFQLVDLDQSFPVFSSDVFEADMWTTNQPSVSSIHNVQNNSLHSTHIILILNYGIYTGYLETLL